MTTRQRIIAITLGVVTGSAVAVPLSLLCAKSPELTPMIVGGLVGYVACDLWQLAFRTWNEEASR